MRRPAPVSGPADSTVAGAAPPMSPSPFPRVSWPIPIRAASQSTIVSWKPLVSLTGNCRCRSWSLPIVLPLLVTSSTNTKVGARNSPRPGFTAAAAAGTGFLHSTHDAYNPKFSTPFGQLGATGTGEIRRSAPRPPLSTSTCPTSSRRFTLCAFVSISSQSNILHRVPVGYVGVGGSLLKTNTTGCHLKLSFIITQFEPIQVMLLRSCRKL